MGNAKKNSVIQSQIARLECKVPPPLLFILTAILMQFTPKVGLFTATWRFWFSGTFTLFALGFAFGSLWLFWRRKTTLNPHTPQHSTQLITTGVFRFSRNPMYLSLASLLLAWGFWLGNILAIGWIGGFVGFLTSFQIVPEENALAKKFGNAFTQYKKQTRRWI